MSGLRRHAMAALAALVVATIPFQPATAAAEPTSPRSIEWGPCPIELPTDRHVDCGDLLVPEIRGHPGGRTVRMAFAIVRAPQPTRPNPVVLLMGGPGFPGIDPFSVLNYFDDAPYVEDRDLILVDYRGERSSDPFLACPEYDELDAATWPEGATEQQALRATAACRDRLAEIATLRHFGTLDIAQDLRDLRLALGLARWNVLAFSAGGEPAFQLLRVDERGTRAILLDAPVTNLWRPSVTPWWWEAPRRMVRLTLDGCRAQPDCHAAFPNLERRFMGLVHRLRAHPRHLEVPVEGGGTLEIEVGGDDLLLDVAYTLGDPAFLAFNPAFLDDLVRSGIDGFYSFPIGPPFPIADVFAEGLTNAYRCREFIAFQTPARMRIAAMRFPEWASIAVNTAAEDRRFCRVWDVGRAPAWMGAYVTSETPALVFQGEWDVAVSNPPIEAAAARLPGSTLVQVPGIGHGALVNWYGWQGCPRSIAKGFFDHPRQKLDASCVDDMPSVDFWTPSDDEVASGRAGMFAGRTPLRTWRSPTALDRWLSR